MFSKFGGCGPSDEVVLSTNSSSSRDLEQRLVRALEPDRRRDLEVHARSAAERAAEVAGPDLARVRKRHQLLVERAEDAAGALRLVHREVGPGDVAHEEAVAGEHRPGLVAAGGVDEGERRVLGAVPGRVDRANREPAELELPSVVEGHVVVVRVGVPVDVDRRAGGGHEPPVARHVVRVVVRLEDVLDVHAEVAGQLEVLRRCRASGPRPPPRRRPRRRSGSWRSRGPRGRAGGRSPAHSTAGAAAE